jgi:hypothetical protein
MEGVHDGPIIHASGKSSNDFQRHLRLVIVGNYDIADLTDAHYRLSFSVIWVNYNFRTVIAPFYINYQRFIMLIAQQLR